MTKSKPSPEYVASRLLYDETTGILVWKNNHCAHRVGKEAGTVSTHGRSVHVCGKLYGSHVLAWVLKTGDWPATGIDHRDLNPLNNSWSNLRLAGKRQNAQNTGVRRDNSSGYKGVSWDAKRAKWRADIRLPQVRKFLGMFADPEAAHQAYAEAAKTYFGEFGRASSTSTK